VLIAVLGLETVYQTELVGGNCSTWTGVGIQNEPVGGNCNSWTGDGITHTVGKCKLQFLDWRRYTKRGQ
jgi:hypothetical protein